MNVLDDRLPDTQGDIQVLKLNLAHTTYMFQAGNAYSAQYSFQKEPGCP